MDKGANMAGLMASDAVEQLRATLSGWVLEPTDADYDETRAVHNGMIEYGADWDRLVELKRRHDPDNVFHLNQNIDPTSG